MTPLLRPQVGRYQHYQGGLYHVFGTAVDEADGSEHPGERVIYRPAGSVATTFVSCRLEDWCEPAIVGGWRVPRFTKVASPGEVERPAETQGEDWPS